MPKPSRSAPDAVPSRRMIPIVEEQAVILKRTTPTEGVRVRTVVHEQEAMIDTPVTRETIEVERVPLGQWVDGPVPVRQEGDTTIVTLVEEVAVVETRLRATAEVRITRHRDIETSSHAVTLRREEAVIERLAALGDPESDAG
ncbi:YsnF/AvaK domain-containing protein [Cereibacter sphaeroides]|uniref:YsnF/AvaK domain-containing protein n=1 Tax=Rhodobacterales TaxID=204455 RepID=UPI001E475F80|nr:MULTISPECIES: YsnF/AvaK domain-containing protein [Paracoccaceae]MCE6960841.1 YsnF/AvaK domain-containing protein [Cereibacter sphaeroides]MCE6969893.1 YsnF/AvaK domain-containing protein [Cereibacter sphaeroides]MCE6974281.1 YsnF/AvaK domain-containing protein [Cereibacter sphaeroides]